MPQPLPRSYRRRLEAEDARKLNRIIGEADPLEASTTAAGATAGGDERKLRGIPAVGRGCAGHIAGTRPDRAFL